MNMNQKIKIIKLTEDKIAKQEIRSWPIWSCGVSEFDWEYGDSESCYLLDGEVEVQSEFETVRFAAGDFVIFPKGLKCKWKITSPVRKHYSFS